MRLRRLHILTRPLLRPRSDLVPLPGHSGTKMDVVQTPQCPELKMFTNDWENVLTIEIPATNLELVLQQLVRK